MHDVMEQASSGLDSKTTAAGGGAAAAFTASGALGVFGDSASDTTTSDGVSNSTSNNTLEQEAASAITSGTRLKKIYLQHPDQGWNRSRRLVPAINGTNFLGDRIGPESHFCRSAGGCLSVGQVTWLILNK